MYTYVMEVKQYVTVEAKSETQAREKLYSGKCTTEMISDVAVIAKLRPLEKEND